MPSIQSSPSQNREGGGRVLKRKRYSLTSHHSPLTSKTDASKLAKAELDVFLLAVEETLERGPFLGNTGIVLGVCDGYIVTFGGDAKEDAR